MNMNKIVDDYLPMSETAYYILLSLTKERHGYGIMQNVEEITARRIRLGAGTIYGTLQKMEKEKLIQATTEVERRKFFILTETGRELLRLEIARMEELVNNGHRIMEGLS